MHENKNILFVYPNQKIITVCNDMKDRDQKDEKTYGCITREAARLAAKKLNDGTAAYILYTHLALSQDGYTFALSPQAIFNELGITNNQYDRAIKKLKENGYLVQVKGNRYNFYTIPQILNDVEQLSPNVDNTPPHVDEGIPPSENSIKFEVDSKVKICDTRRELIPNNTLNNTLNNNKGDKTNEEFIINNQKENNIDSMLKDMSEWISDYKHNQSDTFVSGDEKEYNEVSDENDSKPNISTEFFADIPDVKGDLPF